MKIVQAQIVEKKDDCDDRIPNKTCNIIILVGLRCVAEYSNFINLESKKGNYC